MKNNLVYRIAVSNV